MSWFMQNTVIRRAEADSHPKSTQTRVNIEVQTGAIESLRVRPISWIRRDLPMNRGKGRGPVELSTRGNTHM
jgi:hypothetical protein